MSNTQHFVSNTNIPEFIKTDFELFDTFIQAYYEWLENTNDSENNNYADVYKAVGNPAYVVNNPEIITDLDETIDKFVDFFAEEIVPISLEGIQTNPRTFLKKARELYLAKGTVKSFKLFFKLYYNDNIDVFETRDTVLRASDGKFYAFPTAFFYITELEDNLDRIDFTLAEIQDSDRNVLGTILEGGTVSRTSAGEIIIKTQFSSELDLKQNTNYFIKNADDEYQIQVNALVSLSEITMKEGGSLYSVNDPLYVDSKDFGNRFTGSIKSVKTGNVEGLKVRNRGIFYTADDYFRFVIGDKKESTLNINEVGMNGDILSINNYPLRTGTYNTGYLAGTLEDVFVPVQGTGTWNELPDLEYNKVSNFSSVTGEPYLKVSQGGLGLQAIPVSRSIGKANFIGLDQETFFKDSDDVLLNVPMTVVVENNNLLKGDKVAFQYFGNDANYNPRRDDSESLILRYNFTRIFETLKTNYTYLDSEIHRTMDISIPYGFDSETFKWKIKNVEISTKNSTNTFWDEVTKLLDSEGTFNYRTKSFGYTNQRIDGGVYQSVYYISVFHPYDLAGNKLPNLVNQDLLYSNSGLVEDVQTKSFTFDALNDSEVFDNFKAFIGVQHSGAIQIDTDVMQDVATLDGGSAYSATGDSDIDGGVLGQFYADLIDGFDSFDITNGKLSFMRVEYTDWHADSEISGYQSFAEDSDDITDTFDGGEFNNFAGSKTEVLEIEYFGHYLQTLEDTHLKQIDSDGIGLDSEILQLDYIVIKEEPRILDNNEDSDVGNWVDTGHYGQVVSVGSNNKVVKIISINNSELPSQEEIDSYSEEKYNIVKLSKVVDGKSNKDNSLPLNNVVHQVDRVELEYKTSVVSSLFQKFYTQDGFISSDFGGTIQDNYYYSDYSYRIRTQLPMQTWKEKFKTMLHPAGMVLTSDYALNTEAKAGLNEVDIYNSKNFTTNLTFDMQQEFIDLSLVSKGITTDGIYYKANAFEAVNLIDGTATALNSASLTGISNLTTKQQNGNAFWDYEPIGYVKESIDASIDVLVSNQAATYLNWNNETLVNKYSTQDSDGIGNVKNTHTYYQFFDGSKQDMYKNQSRVTNKLVKDIMLSKVQFEDEGLVAYPILDSDLPDDLFSNFADSDDNFRSIDYQRLKSDSDNRYFQLFKIPRQWDIALFKERDLALAMKENGSLVWDDSDKVYTDYEAYEIKWNTVNNIRTRNNEGYTVKGYQQQTSFEQLRRRSKDRNKDFISKFIKKTNITNAPLNRDALKNDSIVWNHSYYDQINTTIIDKDYENETYKDPKVSMRGRRRR